VIGAAIADALVARGCSVVVIDRGCPGHGASLGNAGMVVPSYSIPMANPQALHAAARSLVRSDTSIRVRLRPDLDLVRWGYRFALACRSRRVEDGLTALVALGQRSLRLYGEMAADDDASFGFRQSGWLYLYRTSNGLAQGRAEAARLLAAGIRSTVLEPADVRAIEPRVHEAIVGGLHYLDDASLDPRALVTALLHRVEEHGGRFLADEVVGLHPGDNRVEVMTHASGVVRAGVLIVAAGAWSVQVARMLGLRLPLQPATGYSLTFPQGDPGLRVPLMLGEAHVVVSPMGGDLRLTGGFELGGFDGSIEPAQVGAMRSALTAYLRIEPPAGEAVAWSGYRPLTPDGLPVVGRLERAPNVILATGHGTLGISLAPATGQAVADLIVGQAPRIDLSPFSPARFGL
jgi:D-amino-acid dehydrogenase